MRISELSERSGVPVATVKYYLREELLPKGEAVSATQARYTEEHLKRLRLVRALAEVAEIPLGRIRAVLQAVDDPELDLHTLLGVAQYAFTRPAAEPAADDPAWQRAERRTAELLAELGWQAGDASPARGRLVRAVAALERLDAPPSPETLHGYAAAAHRTAELDLDRVDPVMPRDETVQRVVTTSALMEQTLSALRLLAQEDESARRFGGTPGRGSRPQGRGAPDDGGADGD
ncbi:MerR family transcriptional regulator [Streptomonospora salina]|uniref:DNA-binding transcriptional MerR regulator n=1 Tax=Streptomonospora salina TaxID=104205 RepID=A0A841E3Y1_9ACTN|nr:MerR family transcriptional regulator [Streptomonospora salina]MBB5997432.1 DNA-binding transcriptional MerR regulator [Streptomonospora salina]